MKIVYSLWTKPLRTHFNTLGFDTLDDFFTSFIFSVNVSKRNYDNIHFYTDEYGLKLIEPYKDQLPFTKIHCILDELDWIPVQWWAYPKLYIYSLQKEPFMHLDNDAYLWDRLDQDLIDNHDFVCQSYEDHRLKEYYFYREGLEFYKDHIPPIMLNTDKYFMATNAGVYGAFNQKGFDLFTALHEEGYKSAKSVLNDKRIVDFVDWNDLRNWDAFLLNVVMEQTYSYIYAKENNLRILQLLMTPTRFTHLLSAAKRNKDRMDKVRTRLINKHFEPKSPEEIEADEIEKLYIATYKKD